MMKMETYSCSATQEVQLSAGERSSDQVMPSVILVSLLANVQITYDAYQCNCPVVIV